MTKHTADRGVRGMAHRAWAFTVVATPHAAAALESVGRSTV